MAKTCNSGKCNNPVFGGGLCAWHQYLRADYKKPDLKKTKIKNVSKKRSKQLRQYTEKRKEFFAIDDNQVCYAYRIGFPVAGCQYHATDINHKEGRENERLLDFEEVNGLCRVCHGFYGNNTKLGIELGIFKSKHQINDQGKESSETGESIQLNPEERTRGEDDAENKPPEPDS